MSNIHLIASAVTSAVFVLVWFQYLQMHTYKILDRKPFNCERCFSFWIYWPTLLIPTSSQKYIIACFLAFFIYKQLKRIYYKVY